MADTAPLRVLIADDEPLAAERLQLLLARADGAQLVGTASDGESAMVTRDVEPSKLSALPNLPEAVQVAPAIVPVLPAPELSAAVAPDPSSKPYAATRPLP